MPTAAEYAQPQHLVAPTRRPVVELLALALPTVAQMASYNAQHFTDTWMLSRLGDLEATAASNASLFGFSLASVGFGTMWVVNTLVSQSFGRGDKQACGQYMWAGVWFGLVYGLLMLPLIPLARPLFNVLGHEPQLAGLEVTYLTLTLSFTAIRLMGASAGQFLLAIDKPNRTLIAAVIAVLFNAFANWVLIWGHFGFPKMGLAGAAWGTNLAAVVEVSVLFAFVLHAKVRRDFFIFDWRPRWERVKTLLRIGLPSGLQTVGDVLAWSVFGMWVMAFFGTQAMAANTYMMRYMSMSFMPAFGLSAGVTALVGRYIGAGRPDVSVARANLGFRLALGYMLTCGLIFFLFGGAMISLFTDDPDVLKMGATLMLFAAIFQLFDALYIIYSGALRGAGDTFVPAVVTATLCWSMVIGIAGLVAYLWPGLGVVGPWAVATAYGAILGLFMWLRFRAGGWRRIRLDHPATDGAFEVVPAAR